jgi:ParB family chromosome partitioning protein
MPQLFVKPLPWFKVNPQVRKQFDEDDLRRLGESMKLKQLQPVLAQPDGALIAGERRYRAALLVGLPSLEVKIAEEQLTESQIKLWQLQENMLRDNLKPLEQVDGVEELARLNPQWQNKEIAEYLHLDPSMVTRLRAVANCSVARMALAEGKLKGISDAYPVAIAPEEKKSSLLTMKLRGASRAEIEAAGRKTRQAAAPSSVKVNRLRCVLLSGIQIVISGEGVSLESSIEALAEAIKEMKRAKDLGYTAKTFAAAMKDKKAHKG